MLLPQLFWMISLDIFWMMITAISTSRKKLQKISRKYPENIQRNHHLQPSWKSHPGLPLKLTGPRRDYPVDAVVTNCTWDAEERMGLGTTPNLIIWRVLCLEKQGQTMVKPIAQLTIYADSIYDNS